MKKDLLASFLAIKPRHKTPHYHVAGSDNLWWRKHLMYIHISFWRTIVEKSKGTEMTYYPFDKGGNYKWETVSVTTNLEIIMDFTKIALCQEYECMLLGPISYKVSKNTWLLPSTSPPLFCPSSQPSIEFVSTSITIPAFLYYLLLP